MLACLAFHAGDAASAMDLLKWIHQLGGCPEHNLLLVSDNVQWSVCLDMIGLGNKSFKNAGLISTKESVQGWPQGANALWKLAAQHCKDYRTPFLWLEPDSIPLKQGWLTDIQKAYNECHKPFFGRIYSCDNPNLPKKLMSGIGVYPQDAIDLLPPLERLDTERAWDILGAPIIVPLSENTRLIHHFWGQKDLAPTFAAVRTAHSPINTFTLDMVDPMSVIFHRNKDGTLINVLRRKMFPEIRVESDSRKFDVVYPFCATDADLALINMQWMAELQDKYNHSIILAVDNDSRFVSEILHIAQQAFEQVIIFKYPVPPVPGHPQAANWVFRHVARYMETLGHPWFWCEPDLIPLKTGWLDVIQAEYNRCGADCMGSVIHELGHVNGTAVYPSNLASTCPNLMSMPDGHWAFDTVIRDEIIGRVHDSGHLMFHVWAQQGDILMPYGSGQIPTFPNKYYMRNIPPGAYTLHRCKDDSLIQRLREQRTK